MHAPSVRARVAEVAVSDTTLRVFGTVRAESPVLCIAAPGPFF